MSFAPTEEQDKAVALFQTRATLKILAFAGAGKTSTLRLLAGTRGTQGLYIAFNKSIATEAKDKFPRTVDCRTTHSLAFRPMSSQYRFSTGKMTTGLQPRQLAEMFELKDRIFGRIRLTRLGQAFLALGTARRFCQSDSPEIAQVHVPRYGRLAGASPEELAAIHDFVLEKARALWARMIAPADQMPLGHDGYLKLWALGNPDIGADYVLLDEAQDSNPAVLGVLARQGSQIVYVGDRHQQIYEWRGAVNAMDRITGCREACLTQSFRFGAAIAGAASAVIAVLGEDRALQGNPSVMSSIGPVAAPDAILARTNAGVMSEIIETLNAERTPHVVGGVRELLRLLDDVVALKKGEPGSCPEFIGFNNWEEVVEFAEGEEGESLRMFVQLVQRFGERHLLWALRRVSDDEKKSDLIISTAHKAKGREWDSVRLSSDFASTRPESPSPDDAERRLFYVAMTRAKLRLDVAPEILGLFTSASVPRAPAADRMTVQPVRTAPPPTPPVRHPVPPPVPERRPEPPPIQVRPSPPPPAAAKMPPQAPVQRGVFRKLAGFMGLE